MSELLQSAHHPDADQLNAFVEHALPTHEHQETLAHLAICADCRAVVSLSMPTVEETLPQPETIRHPWFSGWRLLWPVATAAMLAALLVATIHTRNVSIQRIVPVAPQVAVNEAPTRLTQPSPEAKAALPKKLPKSSDAARAVRPARPLGILDILTQGRDVTTLAGSAISAGASGIASGNGAGIAFDRNAATRPLPQMPPQATTVLNAAPYIAPLVVAGGTTTDEMVTLPLLAREVTGIDVAQAILRRHPLPSGLAALSIVTSGQQNQTLAVDIHGALFLTADAGEHWASVAAPWPGRAISVDLANPRRGRIANFPGLSSMKQSPQSTPDAGAIGGPASAPSGVVLSKLSGTVTDASGAIIPGATVIVSSSPTQLARMAKTDTAGRYAIDGLVPGAYTVEATYPGFMRQQIAAVEVSPGKAATADLTLSVAATTQTVDVTSAADQVVLSAPEAQMSAAPAKTAPSQAVFEITTDSGEHWTSSDGLAWKRK